MKSIIKSALGEKNLGRLDYFLRPRLREGLGGVFNGQTFRLRIYDELIDRGRFDFIAETGTYLGKTTSHFATAGLPVYSVESNPRFYAYSVLRLRHCRNVRLFEGDSLNFLKILTLEPALTGKRGFFYLDAHWYDHLPLREELEIVFLHWSNAIVMVDDFQVPGTDYAFDDYGPGKALTLDYIAPLTQYGLRCFFPSVGPEGETGRKRGCVVLGRDREITTLLESMSTLRRA